MRGRRGEEGSAPSSGNPRSGVLTPPGALFINTQAGCRQGITLKVMGSEVRGQPRRPRGDRSLHLYRLLTAWLDQPNSPTAVWDC